MPRKSFIILAILILIGALLLGYSFLNPERNIPAEMTQPEEGSDSGTSAPSSLPTDGEENVPAGPEGPEDGNAPQSEKTRPLISPISDAGSRVTKKPFGIYVTPMESPVSPERFTGYHNAVDFEILPGEEDADVSVLAVCEGEIIYRGDVNGYGGLLVERCALEGRTVTVLYGHLRLSSIGKEVGESLAAGERVGVLGAGYSAETDGERKHLHFGIHKGSEIDFRGYVQSEAQLAEWLDVRDYI